MTLIGDDEPVYWVGVVPKNCPICTRPIRKTFADAKMIKLLGGTKWLTVDLACLRQYGAGLGTGKGQLYQMQSDGRWLKIDG